MNAASEPASALARAIDKGALVLSYQPKIELRTGRIIGVEALARWPDGPADFVATAEREGMIDRLTEWVCRTALADCKRWQAEGVELGLAVNVSALTLQDVTFPDFLEQLCAGESVEPSSLTVELTESATQHAVHLLDTLTRFRLKGMGVALDDFGTGYSSLLQLRQLPFTELKIDQSFVRDVATAEDSRLIVKSVIDLAHALGLIAVAEGVEDEDTLRVLAGLGCNHAQGFLIAAPMAADRLLAWLNEAGLRWQRFFARSSATSA